MRDFDADRKLCNAATKGPWIATSAEICEAKENETGIHHNVIAGSVDGREKWFSRNDAAFIAAARDGWPDALKRIGELEAENEALKDIIKSVRNAVGFATWLANGKDGE